MRAITDVCGQQRSDKRPPLRDAAGGFEQKNIRITQRQIGNALSAAPEIIITVQYTLRHGASTGWSADLLSIAMTTVR
ncbi:hypothetical protein CES85_2291 [Ochrobactrum quorumnocens]|uniref:Uncharacterized protein n=1 Tax=Ochrobactrum quorumnocens TaxID=271865 RepID=A0A248UK90_9HYPH|nr:hypothetical protein CES85_2291 [[Ochrobactrum] quorumnocens]